MRPEKASIVSELSETLKRLPFVLVTDYRGMKVADFSELRSRLAPAGAEMHVVKNNFLKRAMADSGFPDVGDQFAGQTAVVTGETDVAPVAKILKTGARNFAGAIAWTTFVPGNASGAAVERTGRSVSAIVKRESQKGGRTRGIEDL